MRKRCVSLVKKSVNQLNTATVQEQLSALGKRGIGKTLERFKWVAVKPTVEQTAGNGGGWLYTAQLCFGKKQERERTESDAVFDKQFSELVRRVVSTGRSMGWEPAEKQEAGVVEALEAMEPEAQRDDIELPDLQDISRSKYFGHIFGRAPQIRIMWDSIRAATTSKFMRRGHICCYGPAGCGKTETATAFEAVVGAQNVLRFNSESTTKAGMEQELLDYPGDIPRFIILEEIEKCNPQNLACLLAILDTRAVLKKVNAKIGSVSRECRSLVIATANDMALLKTVLSGAIASRFPHKIYFPRPDENTLARILMREIKDIPGGDSRWIKPIINFMREEGTNDPRRAISLLDGGVRILDKSYFRDQQAILRQQRADEARQLS